MFKKSLLVLSLITLSGAAISAPPIANLRVTGSITPPTCTINGEEEDTFTYDFDISPGIFPASGNLVLTEQPQNIEVVCDALTYLTFTAADERAGTELTTGVNNFGLGTYSDDTNIGFFTVTMSNAKVKANAEADAANVSVLTGTTLAASSILNKNLVSGWATGASQLAAGQIFSADFAVKPTINAVMKNSAGDAQLDGLATLTFAFGL